jgi:hypothetical protein
VRVRSEISVLLWLQEHKVRLRDRYLAQNEWTLRTDNGSIASRPTEQSRELAQHRRMRAADWRHFDDLPVNQLEAHVWRENACIPHFEKFVCAHGVPAWKGSDYVHSPTICRDRFQLRKYAVVQPTKGVLDTFKPAWLAKQFSWHDTAERWHFPKEPAGQKVNGVEFRVRYEAVHVSDDFCERRIVDST